MGTVAFEGLTDAENAFKLIVWNPLVKAGELWVAGAEATIPVLDIPIIQGLEDDVIQVITDAVFNQLVLLVDIESIVLVGAERQAVWASANEQLAIIAQEKGNQLK